MSLFLFLKKKWYITDLGTKLICLLLDYIGFSVLNEITSDPNSSTIKIIAFYIISYGMIGAFLLSLLKDATRSITCYNRYIYIKVLFFSVKLKYNLINYYIYTMQYPSSAKYLDLNYASSKYARFFDGIFCNQFYTTKFRKKT